MSDTVNEYGTPVSAFTCEKCGNDFTVCPAVPDEKRDEWRGCLATECPSYDIDRDPEVMFWLDRVIREDSPKMQAFRVMNRILDENGNQDTDEYRAAFERWQRLAMEDGDA